MKSIKREQTAVEWLIDKLYDYPLDDVVIKRLKQAKAMEKERIVKSHEAGQHYANQFEVPHKTQAEQYYNKTYGDEKSMKTTQTISDRINERPRKRTLNVVRKHERKEYHDLDRQFRFVFVADKTIVRYNNDLIPRAILIR